MNKPLQPGTVVLAPDGSAHEVDEDLAAAHRPGDALIATASGLLHIPAAQRELAGQAVTEAAAAFDAMRTATDADIEAFFHHAADALADDDAWGAVEAINAEDVARARQRGRSTTRLAVSDAMREKMIEGLRGWAAMASGRGAVVETVDHPTFSIDMIAAGLGIVAFVFEGRPNVLADACGVLRSGNSVVFRIGSDALQTAKVLMRRVIEPALVKAGLPRAAVVLIDSTEHAAGWALFVDARLGLAVARGSGEAVELLGSLAQSVGTPVSLHGTGGAWLVASDRADDAALDAAIVRSLDRKVCNTLNTCCLVAANEARVGVVLRALEQAAGNRNANFKLHVTADIEALLPKGLTEKTVTIKRTHGAVQERQVEVINATDLGTEWEWEDSPEITLVGVASIDEAVRLFNEQSPKLVGTLVSDDVEEHRRFFETLDCPFVGDDHTRWVDGQYALGKPELGLSNWENGRLFGRGAVLTGDSVFTLRTRYRSKH